MRPPKTIGFEVKFLSNQIKRCLDESLMNSGLDGPTGMQGWIMGYLFDHAEAGPVFQRDLEKEFNIRRSTVTGILQIMERDGLITREPVKYDARLKEIKLTPQAMAINEKVLRKISEVEDRVRSGLTDEEVAAFFSIAEKIKRNLK